LSSPSTISSLIIKPHLNTISSIPIRPFKAISARLCIRLQGTTISFIKTKLQHSI
jgi:hypothetical protein